MSIIRDLYEKTVAAELRDGTKVTFARLTTRDWAEMARKIRDERMAAELKAIPGAVKDPITQQTLRLRAQAFEPSYYDLIDSAITADGIVRILPFAAIKAGTPDDLAEQIPDLIEPQQVGVLMREIVHAPTGPRVGGDVSEGQRANPTVAESSPQATGENAQQHGSESQSSSTGGSPDGASADSTASTSTT